MSFGNNRADPVPRCGENFPKKEQNKLNFFLFFEICLVLSLVTLHLTNRKCVGIRRTERAHPKKLVIYGLRRERHRKCSVDRNSLEMCGLCNVQKWQ